MRTYFGGLSEMASATTEKVMTFPTAQPVWQRDTLPIPNPIRRLGISFTESWRFNVTMIKLHTQKSRAYSIPHFMSP